MKKGLSIFLAILFIIYGVFIPSIILEEDTIRAARLPTLQSKKNKNFCKKEELSCLVKRKSSQIQRKIN
jgi:hypothetical protein